MEKLDIFIRRLKKIGINIECIINIPFLYLHKINGQVVKEKYISDYGFMLGIFPLTITEPDIEVYITDRTFEIIREYCNKHWF